MATDPEADKLAGIYFPLEQVEQTYRIDVSQLLPVDLYDSLSNLIEEAIPPKEDRSPRSSNGLEKTPNEKAEDYFGRYRRHNAILLEGGRGVGKSTVLVNLPMYLQKRKPDLYAKIHVLQPVDPTQLEDDEDLFLDVIVAAIMSDRTLKRELEKSDAKRRDVYSSLQMLSSALEDRQTSKRGAGIDQLRAFMGSQRLVVAVHQFFSAALAALEKQLLVLSLDDVDTTLARAFENMEVVRRYLSTPLVLPVICGHLKLYHEVLVREYLRRITRDHQVDLEQAKEMARELATEYERKLMPVQSRLRMPDVTTYLRDPKILFSQEAEGVLSIGPAHLHKWIESILKGPVNGLENSEIRTPILTIRAMAQLVGRMRSRIIRLNELLAPHAEGMRPLDIAILLQMPGTSPRKIYEFARAQELLRGKEKTDTESAYRAFGRSTDKITSFPSDTELNAEARLWRQPLHEAFRYEPKAGKVCMVLEASLLWRSDTISMVSRPSSPNLIGSVLDTPLFMPLRQRATEYLEFADREADLSDWREKLKGRLPEDALNRLPQRAIAPFPVPESGRRMSSRADTLFKAEHLEAAHESQDDSSREDRLAMLNVVNELMLHRGYYSASQRSPLLLTGRLLELIITGLVRDVRPSDVQRLLNAPPFHSAGAMAPTKTLILDGAEEITSEAESLDQNLEPGIELLAQKINVWRADLGLKDFAPSPWLIYNALNKCLAQAWFFNNPDSGSTPPDPAFFIGRMARTTFDCFWSAVGSFEKGPLFGLPAVVATTNMGDADNFEQAPLYRQNISPFIGLQGRRSFGLLTRSVTHALATHPLRELLRWLNAENRRTATVRSNQATAANWKAREDVAKKWLRKRLGGTGESSYLGPKLVASLITRGKLSLRDVSKVMNELQHAHPQAHLAHAHLRNGVKLAFDSTR